MNLLHNLDLLFLYKLNHPEGIGQGLKSQYQLAIGFWYYRIGKISNNSPLALVTSTILVSPPSRSYQSYPYGLHSSVGPYFKPWCRSYTPPTNNITKISEAPRNSLQSQVWSSLNERWQYAFIFRIYLEKGGHFWSNLLTNLLKFSMLRVFDCLVKDTF